MRSDATIIAQIVLLSWPLVAMAMIAVLGRARGLIWSTCLGYLFLPEALGLRLSGLPDYDKTAAIALGVMLGALAAPRQEAPVARRETVLRPALILCIATVIILSPLATWLANTYPIAAGDDVRPGLTWRDFASMSISGIVSTAPFIAALAWLRAPAHRRELALAIMAFGLVYMLFALVEMRMSPQFSNWVYGYFPHSFAQHYKNGYWRPVVFLSHGLAVGFFFFSAVMAAIAIARSDPARRPMALGAAGALFVILVLSQNLGALAIALVLVPVALLAGARVALGVAAAIGVVFLFYPAIHQAGLVPLDRILDLFAGIDPNRAASLAVRLRNEALLIDRALESPWVGLGGWRRSLPINDHGFLADGAWILVWGFYGWLGYLAIYGLLVLPILALRHRSRHEPAPFVNAVLALTMAGNFVYLIVNSTLSPIAYVTAGALAAAALWRGVEEGVAGAGARSAGRGGHRAYTRFPSGPPEPVLRGGPGPTRTTAPAARRSPQERPMTDRKRLPLRR